MKKLERENERLRAENAFRGNRKEATLSQVRYESKYVAIQELHKEKRLAIALLYNYDRYQND
ncbi:hypothetical protein [Paenibacillus larvae]|uniref:hypothetical protein n=1 Tax=Paenibacillus larvae TaxID=1464 RepID=UPI00098F3E84|nr:hypothetical protein [Paenibacillus larvae]AQZ46537.1 hypothetical protein B5S25_07855 [Paenibacillus larvae subsp. pulvifaciens]MBH0341707.1 hypothetical protein [Paenibacillus larvae]MCY9750924.1 hypothetical protein [Paenibacillus larvae]MCY9773019.1 hypothetical protein [Paenibacillus larvae]MEC0187139.1 hypothetical protein [Paenibacillus larvae]